MRRRLTALGLVSLAAELGLFGVNALNQQSFRRAPRGALAPALTG